MAKACILEGDCLSVLATLPPESVQTCITSPPYYGLRDYGHAGQIGLEETPDQYVANLVAVFREVRRVLRDDGTLWLNLGDSYGTGTGRNDTDPVNVQRRHEKFGTSLNHEHQGPQYFTAMRHPYKPKDLLGIPWMVAFALRADGWYLRSDIIWAKPNPMPESVTDRPTKAHEYLFLLSKCPRYYYDADAIREPHESEGAFRARDTEPSQSRANLSQPQQAGVYHVNGRNKRSVWTTATQPYAGAHFATFPPKLIEPCVLAGSSQQACAECGAPWSRVVERTPMVVEPSARRLTMEDEQGGKARTQTGGTMTQAPTSQTVGWEPTCGHDDGTGRSVVLDPFSGAGTTGMVALRHERDYVGIELNPEYAQMARDRLYDDAPLLNEVA